MTSLSSSKTFSKNKVEYLQPGIKSPVWVAPTPTALAFLMPQPCLQLPLCNPVPLRTSYIYAFSPLPLPITEHSASSADPRSPVLLRNSLVLTSS